MFKDKAKQKKVMECWREAERVLRKRYEEEFKEIFEELKAREKLT